MLIIWRWLLPLSRERKTRNSPSSSRSHLARISFFKEAHVKLRPVEFGTDGVYLCGIAHYPKHITETINQAYGAAGRVLTLSRMIRSPPQVLFARLMRANASPAAPVLRLAPMVQSSLLIHREGERHRSIPFSAKAMASAIRSAPTRAITLKHFTDEEILSEIDALTAKAEVPAPTLAKVQLANKARVID